MLPNFNASSKLLFQETNARLNKIIMVYLDCSEYKHFKCGYKSRWLLLLIQ